MNSNQNGSDAPESNQASKTPEASHSHLAPLKQITPLSKYLAMTLFVMLPFVGAWIGYQFAPEEVVEVEKVVEKRIEVPAQSQNLIYSSDYISEPSTSTERMLFSRQDLFNNEDELYKEFGLKKW